MGFRQRDTEPFEQNPNDSTTMHTSKENSPKKTSANSNPNTNDTLQEIKSGNTEETKKMTNLVSPPPRLLLLGNFLSSSPLRLFRSSKIEIKYISL